MSEQHKQNRELSTQERATYNALDPFAATTSRPWDLEVTSPTMRRIAIVWVVIVMAVHIFMALVVGVGYTGAAVTTIDKWAFIGVGIVISVVCYIGLSRPRVRANADGVEVRNFIGTRFYSWAVIYGLSFPKGSRMARLELPDFEFVPLWAFQAADRSTIVQKVDAFRRLEAQYMPKD
ncbi:hypothetical membrane protein [Corynebacterium renale]|uniref:PH (Pleckstrin Homology) domain-containing protein n=1 Tax=Corynebacterium renale TaxID=1724 RepID=A0A2A9DPZ7_9CORY|nr:PH domain-containing protein [Corynebacterium renale]PFG28664.1 PH (Pleckstrin Homology) domain-containing protein [Corynebacterium renale]SQG64744.1 hypothetical membrane protein [Corynebacterium renale]SQI26098.1 hypothetical membrane protein [Corynebacterium renale]STC96122.1 hypothetical membrane protein [Corynebacterium renale]